MTQERKRIGLLLASIHTGVSQNVWTSFVDTAAAENTALFIFPGGRLNTRQDFENLRNQVFYLANDENLDGCISWSSSIRYNQSNEEFEHFHAILEPLPYVTLAFKMPGHPCVDFESYNGMKALITHCIKVHGAKKIAFLRGPDLHTSAQSRYKGYLDALKEAGLAAADTDALVTDPFDWGEGDAAASQLFEKRSLVPGRDFDTLAGSSDMMALGAINYFISKGYHVPADYHAVGFNNSMESRVTESPLSTVHLPYAEMSGKSFKILLENMGRKKNKSGTDVLLDTEVIIRESCGCIEHHSPEIEAFDYYSDNDSAEEKINKIVKDYLELENKLKIQEQRSVRARYEKEKWNTALNSLKCELLGTRDRFSLVQSLARHLPKIGITTAAVVLYGDAKTSILAGGFSADGISPVKDLRFPARLLVPANIKPQFRRGAFLVQPLFIENQSLGYFVHNVSMDDGVILEELRSSISYALKGIISYEEIVHAKRVAEQSERAKTEFIQALENGLYDPFQGVMDRLESLEKNMASAGVEKKALDDLENLKSFVSSREAQTGSIFDFTLVRMDEFSINKTIFAPEDILPKIGTFPLLLGDTSYLTQCFSSIREHYGDAYTAELSYGGLAITFRKMPVKEKERKDETEYQPSSGTSLQVPGLLLAERIIKMHGGVFTPDTNYCTVTLPWTTLSGQELSRNPVSFQDHVLVLSDPASLPANLFSLPQTQDAVNSLPGKIAFIAWNAASADSGDLVKVAGLRRKSELAGVPFLCYGMPKGSGGTKNAASSILDAIEFALKSPKKGTVLFVGPQEYWDSNMEIFFPKNETHLDKIRIDNMAAFDETVSEVSPLLIIFNTLDSAGAAAVRRHPLTVMVPILMVSDRINKTAEITALSQYSRLILCHRAIVPSPEFQAKIQALTGGEGDEILPPHTGILVKKAILYLGQHAESHISRWKLADSVNVSEDYLTRIFHREMGLSLWDYLNRYRVFLAAEFLCQTDDTIQDIAFRTGFQDSAYFCRVFKKIYGIPPGKLRRQ